MPCYFFLHYTQPSSSHTFSNFLTNLALWKVSLYAAGNFREHIQTRSELILAPNLNLLCDLLQGVQGISDIITIPGLVNVDFADVKAIMCNSGTAMLGVGVSSGKNRAEEAAAVRILLLVQGKIIFNCH